MNSTKLPYKIKPIKTFQIQIINPRLTRHCVTNIPNRVSNLTNIPSISSTINPNFSNFQNPKKPASARANVLEPVVKSDNRRTVPAPFESDGRARVSPWRRGARRINRAKGCHSRNLSSHATRRKVKVSIDGRSTRHSISPAG